ncbi:hypothetical protein PCANC_00960 [Puccinia coronata f. sp. avenae]|uniref:Uncharacterized protein n=1 Tax=Puccinia coronata f. sp. avenae TaxID=200324 RepID=A0A2N5W6M3_9BASI|nr:hypothetical protein PCANC_00960 [Puccinia coronata f. sp. avenae]
MLPPGLPNLILEASRPSLHAARHLHAFNRHACGVQACDPARQACRGCTPVWRGVQSLHALRTGVQALHACRLT